MNSMRRHGGFIIFLSFVLALILSVNNLTDGLRPWRPDWVALVLIYWCLYVPERISVASGWFAGLCLDVLTNSLLGQHALGLAIIAFFANALHRQIRIYPFWQQTGSVLVFLLMHQLTTLWINSLSGHPSVGWEYWLPSFTGMLLWPLVYLFFQILQRYFSIK
ncbi:MAG: rod shape-determining protein MreD [Gammaproteobacteria bacterium]